MLKIKEHSALIKSLVHVVYIDFTYLNFRKKTSKNYKLTLQYKFIFNMKHESNQSVNFHCCEVGAEMGQVTAHCSEVM